jgi:hypothetical protein
MYGIDPYKIADIPLSVWITGCIMSVASALFCKFGKSSRSTRARKAFVATGLHAGD